MKVGDLVLHTEQPEHGVGIITTTGIEMWGQAHEPPGVKVLWSNPVWVSDDGCSIMYEDEIEVINESRR